MKSGLVDILPLLHAGHAHGPWDRFVEVIGLLGILALGLGVLVLPVCAAIYFFLARILLDRRDLDKVSTENPPEPEGEKNPLP